MNSLEKVSITASLYACMTFWLTLGLETGFAPVSATHSAVGSPVIIGIVTPLPGSVIRRARRMIALCSVVFWMISLLISVGSDTALLFLSAISVISFF